MKLLLLKVLFVFLVLMMGLVLLAWQFALKSIKTVAVFFYYGSLIGFAYIALQFLIFHNLPSIW